MRLWFVCRALLTRGPFKPKKLTANKCDEQFVNRADITLEKYCPAQQHYKGMDNIQTQQRLAPYRSSFVVVDFICWNALAVTTGAMVVGAAKHPLQQNFGENYYPIVLAVTVAAVYLMVDFGLSGRFKNWLRDRYDLRTSQQHNQVLRRVSWLILLFLLVRIFATGLSSIWAGGEISEVINSGDPTQVYRNAIASNDSTTVMRLQTAQQEYDNLKHSENKRVTKATQEADQAIALAIAAGNPDQRRMFRENRNFFENLSPTSQWTPGNRKFYQGILNAEQQKRDAINSEQAKTQAAVAVLYATTTDTTATAFNNAMSKASTLALQRQQTRRNRHERMIIGFDIFSLFGGLFCSWIIVLIDVASGHQRDERNLSFLFGQLLHKLHCGFLDMVESLFGIDINGDGKIGLQSSNDRSSSEGSNYKYLGSDTESLKHEATTSPIPSAGPNIKGGNPIGFGDYGHAGLQAGPDTVVEEIIANTPVATRSYKEKLPDPYTAKANDIFNRYKLARKTYHSYKHRRSAAAKQRVIELQQEMSRHVDELAQMNIEIHEQERPVRKLILRFIR